jgi:hypothetical protein
MGLSISAHGRCERLLLRLPHRQALHIRTHGCRTYRALLGEQGGLQRAWLSSMGVLTLIDLSLSEGGTRCTQVPMMPMQYIALVLFGNIVERGCLVLQYMVPYTAPGMMSSGQMQPMLVPAPGQAPFGYYPMMAGPPVPHIVQAVPPPGVHPPPTQAGQPGAQTDSLLVKIASSIASPSVQKVVTPDVKLGQQPPVVLHMPYNKGRAGVASPEVPSSAGLTFCSPSTVLQTLGSYQHASIPGCSSNPFAHSHCLVQISSFLKMHGELSPHRDCHVALQGRPRCAARCRSSRRRRCHRRTLTCRRHARCRPAPSCLCRLAFSRRRCVAAPPLGRASCFLSVGVFCALLLSGHIDRDLGSSSPRLLCC